MANRRTRWIRWARETAKARRRITASPAPVLNGVRFWKMLPTRVIGDLHFQGKKPNPFRGKRFPYAMEDGYLRGFVGLFTQVAAPTEEPRHE